jgi:hypothetical protein
MPIDLDLYESLAAKTDLGNGVRCLINVVVRTLDPGEYQIL